MSGRARSRVGVAERCLLSSRSVTLRSVPIDDEALGRTLERLSEMGGASEFMPAAPGVEPAEHMRITEELLRRGWIDGAADYLASGSLFMARDIRMTVVGAEALQRLRASAGRPPAVGGRPTPLGEKRRRRLEIMNRLYEITNGSRLAGVNMWELGSKPGGTAAKPIM